MSANRKIYIHAMGFIARTRRDHTIVSVKMERILPTQKKRHVFPPMAKILFPFQVTFLNYTSSYFFS